MRLLLPSCLLAAAASCARAESQELRALRAQVDAMRAQVSRHEAGLADLSNQVFVLSDKMAASRAALEQERKLPELKVVRLVPPEPKVAPEPPAIDVTAADLEDTVAVTKVPPPPSFAATTSRRDDSADRDFRDALKAFREGHADEATKRFSKFLTDYPSHPDADMAMYWQGEARFEVKAYALSVQDFTKLLTSHPRTSKAPDALLKMGLAFERLGAPDRARQAFQDLVTNYPNSAQSDLARARLGGRGEAR